MLVAISAAVLVVGRGSVSQPGGGGGSTDDIVPGNDDTQFDDDPLIPPLNHESILLAASPREHASAGDIDGFKSCQWSRDLDWVAIVVGYVAQFMVLVDGFGFPLAVLAMVRGDIIDHFGLSVPESAAAMLAAEIDRADNSFRCSARCCACAHDGFGCR